jgi:hypothetical protein
LKRRSTGEKTLRKPPRVSEKFPSVFAQPKKLLEKIPDKAFKKKKSKRQRKHRKYRKYKYNGKNPLQPYRDYLKMREDNQLQEIKQFSPEKIRIIKNVIDREEESDEMEMAYISNIKEEQMITIGILKR